MKIIVLFFSVLVLSVFLIDAVASKQKENQKETRKSENNKRFQSIDDNTLFSKLDKAEKGYFYAFENNARMKEHFDLVLQEIIRRGNADLVEMLKTRLSKMNLNERNSSHDVWGNKQLELLASLRRIQRKSDPLTIEVKSPSKLKATTRNLPAIDVALVSNDVEKKPVWIKNGGDYRSGRQARWRIEVKDSKGNAILQRERAGGMGGGIYTEGFLKHGQKYETKLWIGNFVDLPEPGEYTVQLYYHNTATIAYVKEKYLKDLILFKSKPFRLKVELEPKRIIQLIKGSRGEVKTLLKEVVKQQEVKIVCGNYEKYFYKFVSPNSSHGKILSMDWQAVPELLTQLENKGVSAHDRSWIFALLDSITHERDFSPLNYYGVMKYFHSKSYGGYCKGGGGGYNVAVQDRLASKWLKLRDRYYDIREPVQKQK